MLEIRNLPTNFGQNLPSSPGFLYDLSIETLISLVERVVEDRYIAGGEGGFCSQVIGTASIYSINPPLQVMCC
jgi:hypothetical protein